MQSASLHFHPSSLSSCLRRPEALPVLSRVHEAIDHSAEVAGVRSQVENPRIEAGLIRVTAQIAKILGEHERAIERRHVVHEPRVIDNVTEYLRARLHRVI